MSSWEIAYVALSVWAIAQALVHGLQTWEHRRFARSRVRNVRASGPKGRIALLAPCKGIDTQMSANLRALFDQEYDNYEILFVVESRDDPAADVIESLIQQYPSVDARLIIAGRTVWSGQKVHNLMCATRQLSPEIEYLAFVDSDARPRRHWLGALIKELDQPDVAATTSYRWCIPRRPTLVNLLLYSIDCSIVPFVGPARHHLVWGGSWAIRRDTFEQIGLRNAWRGTVSDDLVTARVLARTGKRVVFEPACVLASPVDMTWTKMFAFIRRQYTLGRMYTPAIWASGFLLTTVSHFTLWLNLCLSFLCVTGVVPFSPIPLIVATTLYGLYVLRAWIRQNASRQYLPSWQTKLRYGRWFDITLAPVAALLSWAGLVSSAFGNTIDWRGIRYKLSRGGRVLSIARPPERICVSPPEFSRADSANCVHVG